MYICVCVCMWVRACACVCVCVCVCVIFRAKWKVLLLGSIQLRTVYPFPNAKDVYRLPYLFPCFCFSWSPSLGSSVIVAVFLSSSLRYPLVNHLRPTNIFHCKDVFIHLLWILSLPQIAWSSRLGVRRWPINSSLSKHLKS